MTHSLCEIKNLIKVQNVMLSKITLKHVEKPEHPSTGEMTQNAESIVHQAHLITLHMVILKKLVKAPELLLPKGKLPKVN